MRRKPVRILSFGVLPPELGGSKRGGVATFHAVLLEEFASGGHGIEVAGVFVLPPDELDPERVDACPAPVLGGRTPRDRKRRHQRMLRRQEPDAIVFNHVTHRRVARWAQLHHDLAPEVPGLGIAHSWHPVTHLSDRAGREQAAQEGFGSLQALCFGSRHCRAEGEGLGFAYPQVTEVIHYPLQHAFLTPTDVEGEPRSGVAYVGSLIPRKNVSALIEAIGMRPDLHLTIAGEGAEEAELRTLTARLDLERRVTITGHYPIGEHVDRMRELMLGSEVLCLPSTSESFGLVMIEALACGTPVVGFGPTLAEIEGEIEIPCGERLTTADPDAIATAIDRVLAREWDRAELRRRTIETFAPERAAARYARLISGLAH